ncbi:MAG: phosphate ABC transporter permease subunit PstC [Anaerolineales bacterium]|nr:phosphate ABC transporter permease subunit PstC [Anaerolineales bacterium]
MNLESKQIAVKTARETGRPLISTVLVIILVSTLVGILIGGIYYAIDTTEPMFVIPALIVALLFISVLAKGIWNCQEWARSALIIVLVFIGLYYGMSVVFQAMAEIFSGEHVKPVLEILAVVGKSFLCLAGTGLIPGTIIFLLNKQSYLFIASLHQRKTIDKTSRYVLIAAALCSIIIVFLIILFTMIEAWESVQVVGIDTMLLGTIWRPGSIIGSENVQLGLVPMIAGSILSTIGAAVLGIPLSIGTAILLAEIAPNWVREIIRPAIELLAGIPSVVYGLFGLVVLAPLIRKIEIPYNTGFGILNASIILAVMIIPTVTNIAEDAIRAVPRYYKEGSLALGATTWQTIINVILPAARSGLVAAVILGIGRALGETMAVIMVIGNSIAIPEPLNDNPLTLFLCSARTLTGNIAVEINYAAGVHRSALFFTGIMLFTMILLVNQLARFLMRERQST